MNSNQLICEIQWDRVPLVYSQKDARTWLGFQAGRGLALNTLDACGRNLERYLRFLNKCNKQPHEITQEVVGAYLRDLVKAVLPYSVPLESLLKRRQVFSCLARRVFGFKRFAAAEKKIKARLRELGYHHRTLRLVPLTLAQLLLIVRSPRIEDITEAALIQLQKRNGTVAMTCRRNGLVWSATGTIQRRCLPVAVFACTISSSRWGDGFRRPGHRSRARRNGPVLLPPRR